LFLLLHNGNSDLHNMDIRTGSWAHPVSYTMGTGSFTRVKRPGSGVDNPPPPSAGLKKGWSYASTPPLGLRDLF